MIKKILFYFSLLLLSFQLSAKIIIKPFTVDGFSLTTVDVNSDGIADLTFYPLSTIYSDAPVICSFTPPPSPHPCSNSTGFSCRDIVFSTKISLNAININDKLSAGNFYRGIKNANSYSIFTMNSPPSGGFPQASSIFLFREEQPLSSNRYTTNSNYQSCLPGSNSIITSSNCFGNSSTKYIAFTINGADGLKYYGWIRQIFPNSYEAAYEDVPGYPIAMGDRVGYFTLNDPNYNVIRGKVYYETDNNCIVNAGETGISNIIVSTTPGNYIAITDAFGNYEIIVPGGTSNYSIDIDYSYPSGLDYIKKCPIGTLSAAFNGFRQTQDNKNFSVETSSCSNLNVSIASDRRRRCFRSSTTVGYRNFSTINSAAAVVKVVLPQFVKPISSIPNWSFTSGDTLFYTIGVVNGLSGGIIKIIDSVMCGNESIRGLTECTEAFISPLALCITSPNWDKADLNLKGRCTDDDFLYTITNNGLDMSDSVAYRVYLDGTLVKTKKLKLHSNSTTGELLPINGKSLRIEVDQTPNHPQVLYKALNFEGCGNFSTQIISKNISNQFPPISNGLASASDCQMIRDSYDPNDKSVKPSGFDSDHKILPNGELEYFIRFQNTGNDEAYTVVIVDTLDSNLDFNTFSVVGSSHPYKLLPTNLNNPRLVWVFGGINLPDSTTNEPASHGYIKYTIRQKSNLSIGTVIKNRAHIFFDYNSAILTNQVTNKIHNAYPSNLLSVTTHPAPVQKCTNDSLSLTVSGTGFGALNYTWFANSASINSNSPDLKLINLTNINTGNYRCRIDNAIDTIYSNSALVTVVQNPFLTITDPNPDCNEVDITSTYTDSHFTMGNVSYWSDSQLATSVSAPNTISSSGQYYIKKETALGCADTAIVNVTIHPSPELAVTDPSAVCNSAIDITGSFIDANATTGTVTYWMDAQLINALTSPNAVTSSGQYYIKKETSFGCADTAIVNATIHPSPELAVTDPSAVCNSAIDITGSFIDANATTGTVTYWMDAQLINALTSPNTVTSSGQYYIKKETSFGCADIAAVNVIINSCTNTLEKIEKNVGVKIYPNPIVEKLILDGKGGIEFTITNQQGIKIYHENTNDGITTIDLNNYSAGPYYLSLKINNEYYTVLVVKQ